MKLLTLNTHSLAEEAYTHKLEVFVDAIYKERPGIIALQEVNQSICEVIVSPDELMSYTPCDTHSVIRKDNHAYQVVKKLHERGVIYYWTWLGIKISYGKFDEGIALLSLSPITETDVLQISKTNDYHNWKTRKIVGIRTAAAPKEWYYCVHYGWWNDAEEPFAYQWRTTVSSMKKGATIWLLGDFNSPSNVRHEGYDMIASSGWYDSYAVAQSKDSGNTVDKIIDGWRKKTDHASNMRIDYIWCNKIQKIKNSQVIFNTNRYEIISDHYGVMIEYERS
ncbi:MAG: hypothetical protein E7269_06815 [Lachnospiraceae bacterium]|nr:hypothetical protein [Lachnospiraceae bacterium]